MHMRTRRGLTHREVIVLVLAVIFILVIFLIMTQGLHGHGPHNPIKDATQLSQINKAMTTFARQFDGRFPTPSKLRIDPITESNPEDNSLNTTANLYSMCIAQNYFSPQIVVSPTEPSANVLVKSDYAQKIYKPLDGIFWDHSFKADLETGSHASYAHLPMFGERYEKHWKDDLDSEFAMFGNRGPKDGIDNPESVTYQIHGGRDTWNGNICWADGHVSYETAFKIDGVSFTKNNKVLPDNLFRIDDDMPGKDIILTFTKKIWSEGFEMQFD